jgi:hypothetical protein
LPATDLAGRAETPPASETHPISFNITVMVTVTPACPQLLPEGFSPLTATYSLHLPTQDAIPGNQNPVLSGIFVTANYDPPDAGTPPAPPGQDIGDGGISSDDGGVPAEADGGQPVAVDAGSGHDGPDGSVPLEDDPAITVKRDKHVGVQLDVDISTAEHLAVPGTIDYDSKAGLTRHYEHLAFSWYAEAGSFTGSGKGPNTGYLPTALPEGQDSPPSQTDNDNFAFNTTNTWDLPKTEDYSYATSRIIVVVRDGRGGVGWTSKQVRLEGTP